MKRTYYTTSLILVLYCIQINQSAIAQNTNKILSNDVLIPGGIYDMGDHFGFVDPLHPSDEIPIHTVHIDSFYIANTVVTNQQFLNYLTSALSSGLIHVANNIVYSVADTNIICYTNQYATYYSLGFNGSTFSIVDFRADHPMVGVLWYGATAYCNWLSSQNGYQSCYNLTTGDCDSTKNGYRLPTEAEWEWAGRGGHTNPYYNYPWGNDLDTTKANWPISGDPYETGTYPYTTPVGFYDGTLKLKSTYNWPGAASSYQTNNGANSYGLYDMAGNVWQFVNDWYGRTYYSSSVYNNPKGPITGTLMPDNKPYRCMRGGNWYNGDVINSVNDGHSRISNRDPSYFRGPQDPNHPWYHVGFRVARNYSSTATGINTNQTEINSCRSFPNPFNSEITFQFNLEKSSYVVLEIFNSMGQLINTLVNEKLNEGIHNYDWNAVKLSAGIYTYTLKTESLINTDKIILIK